MNISDVRRNALALALVLTAANIATTTALVLEAHKLREQAQAQCARVMQTATKVELRRL